MNKYYKAAILAFVVFTFMMMTGCATLQKKDNGLSEVDEAFCQAEKAKATGYDYIQRAINRGNVYRACVALKKAEAKVDSTKSKD